MNNKPVAIQNKFESGDNMIRIEWNMGKRCNFNCSYCNENIHDNFSPYISFKTAKKTIDEIIRKTNKKIKISITGGEPTINPDFLNIVYYMKKCDIKIGMTTNGSRSKEYYVDCMRYLDSIIFSYHMEYHKREKIIDSILACKNFIEMHPEKRMHVHVMMLPGMFDEAKNLIHLLKENDVNVVTRRIRPTFKKNHSTNIYSKNNLIKGVIAEPFYNGPTVILTHEDITLGPDFSKDSGYYSEEELKFFKKDASTFNNVLTYTEYTYTEENVNDILARKENSYFGWKCWSGLQTLHIDSNGTVFNATCKIQKLGNINTNFTMPTEPVYCSKKWCVCAADLTTTKIKNEKYMEKIRIDK